MAEVKQVTPIQAEMLLESVSDVPAIYSNIFNVAAAPQFVRLTFGESVFRSQASIRAAFIISTDDAKKLANALLQGVEAAEKAATQQTVVENR